MNKRVRQLVRAFTLVELIVVMVVMTILAGLSAMAYRGIADDLRMSSAMNTIVAALDNARAQAIKTNRYVMTVFRPRLDSDGTEQVIDIVVAEWVGDSASANRGDGDIWTYDRFVPIKGMQVRTLTGGVNVAGPEYGTYEGGWGSSRSNDNIWLCSTYLPANVVVPGTEPVGSLIGILYNPEGRVVVRNAETGSDRMWVDFDNNWTQTIDDAVSINWEDANVVTEPWATAATPDYGSFFHIKVPYGEPFISMTPILAVFNETALRTELGTGVQINVTDITNDNYCKEMQPDIDPWDDSIPNCSDGLIDSYDRNWLYTIFIHKNADRIQFNRYSGVPLQ